MNWDRLGIPVAWASASEIVVVKPAGMAVELTRDPRGESLLARVRAHTGADAFLPHRLDRVTRGFVVVALSAESAAWHGAQIMDGAWTKVYLARVRPEQGLDPETLLGEHKAYLRQRGMHAEVVRSGGKPARLIIEGAWPAPLGVGGKGDWHIVVRLLTGRFHQIRAMASDLGAPLVGDDQYGGAKGAMYLEHIGLRFRPMDGADHVRLFQPNDLDRESVSSEALECVRRILTEP